MAEKLSTDRELTMARSLSSAGSATDIDDSKQVTTHLEKLDERASRASEITPGQRARIAEYYGRKAQDDHIAPAEDVTYIVDQIAAMSDARAIEILRKAAIQHQDDPNFPDETMLKIQQLLERSGSETSALDDSDYSFDLRAEAAVIHYHSPYAEVRSVTEPFDDPTIPVETFRAYFLGLIFMSGCTAINTFFGPRQPSIQIAANVLQLLIYPCGKAWARALPDWGFTFRNKRYSLNPGPWSYKEQMFATIIFSVANGAGATYYIYLVQRLPQYLNQQWVRFPYEICLALSTQFFGLGYAGILRRFVVYPEEAIWPKVLPTLALNRALLVPEKKGEVVNGWRLSRYKFFFLAFIGMFLWFFVPNFLFGALRSFNWMTWIAPNNFNLGMVTGFYGGMGFNPISTFDWNVAGTSILVTPFFSALQQYGARVLSGLIIIGMYYGNYVWSAYMPINSNEAFDNTGKIYEVGNILNNSTQTVDVEKYKAYGPPYFSGANVFGQGAWFAWYPMTLFYMSITYWTQIKNTFAQIYRGWRNGESVYEQFKDPHTRAMSRYKEAPDWWFWVILLASLVIGIVALEVWPVHTPVWSLFAIMGISLILLIPSAILYAVANVSMGFNVLFQLLGGVWFAGNPEASIICTVYGQNFDAQADTFISDLKIAHYAKLPPRAVFRAQCLSILINCFIFIGMLDWMIESFDNGTLCTWDNAQHFVCTDAVLVFASAVEYGAFGVKNMFKLYPILPWCFLMGGLVGIGWGLARRYGSQIRAFTARRFPSATTGLLTRYFFQPLAHLKWFNPAVFWAGALNWTGGNNLSYATCGIYISFVFMYIIKRRYTAWWEKYNYLLEAGFDVGVAISGVIQTLAFDFTNVSLNWWGNTVSQAGVDYASYNQNASLLAIPNKGYFGLAPEEYPLSW